MKCKECGGRHFTKLNTTPSGTRYYRCQACLYSFGVLSNGLRTDDVTVRSARMLRREWDAARGSDSH